MIDAGDSDSDHTIVLSDDATPSIEKGNKFMERSLSFPSVGGPSERRLNCKMMRKQSSCTDNGYNADVGKF